MKKSMLCVLAVALAAPAVAAASPFTYQAFLDGPSENPPNASPGTGTATVVYDDVAHTLSVDVTFADLIGTTTVAHIHCCIAPPGIAGVASPTPTYPGFPVGVTSGSYSQSFDLTQSSSWNSAFVTDNGGTTAGAEAALAAGLANGEAYFNIHTSFASGGEIRGFFALVPEPSTALLLAPGLVGLAIQRRRSARARRPQLA